MNPDRWKCRWLLLVPFLVSALISHRWKMVLPVQRSVRIPTSKTKYLPTEKEAVKVVRSLTTGQSLLCNSHSPKGVERWLNEPLALKQLVDFSYLDSLYGLMSLQL